MRKCQQRGHFSLHSVDHETKRLRVMKFGGSSVGDASCIRRVVEIVERNLSESDIVVVVSAMSGVTNRLIEAAARSEAGDVESAASIFDELYTQHLAAADSLLGSPLERSRIHQQMRDVLQVGKRLCEKSNVAGAVTPEARDVLASLGERLMAPLLAAALIDRGVASEAVEATEVVVTDSCHGAADPQMHPTRERCEQRIRPLLRRHIVPVVTGFIGATPEGTVTTLGRGGSDYSATILGAALDADEVIIWTDVDGLLTADPRIVSAARTIPEISYREAADLAYFGAKVLHPKTLRAVMQHNVPVWVRNTFAPDGQGTKIIPRETAIVEGVMALSVMSEATLITIELGITGGPNVVGRALAALTAARSDVLLSSQTSSENNLWFIVPSALAHRAMEVVRREFTADATLEEREGISQEPNVAIITLVGGNIASISGVTQRALDALRGVNVPAKAAVHTSSGYNISFILQKKDMKAALTTLHDEFQLGQAGIRNMMA